MFKLITKENYSFDDLLNIIAELRGENGCDWDKAQTHESINKYLIEECYEYIEAVEQKDFEKQADELGDVLLQIILNAQIGREEGSYDINDVINCVSKKMIYRHPHVFSDTKVDSVDEILSNWEELKKKEQGAKNDKETVEKISKALPVILRAQKIIKKLNKQGKKNLIAEDDNLKNIIINSNNPQEKITELFLQLVSLSIDYDSLPEIEINNLLDSIIEKL